MALFGPPQQQTGKAPQAGLMTSPGAIPSLGQTAAPGNIASPGVMFSPGKTNDLASVFGQSAFGFDPFNGQAPAPSYSGGGFNGGRQRVIR